jgi:hypothetical protein
MKLTKAQRSLLEDLTNGAQIVFRQKHYVVVFEGKEDHRSKNIWPSTFYGLFDGRLIEVNRSGSYTISRAGRDHREPE